MPEGPEVKIASTYYNTFFENSKNMSLIYLQLLRKNITSFKLSITISLPPFNLL